MSGARTIAVTGATGLLGRELCARFARSGWRVRALCRRPALAPAGTEPVMCDLPGVIAPGAFEGADVVVHAAYSMRAASRQAARRTNVDGSHAVLEAVRRAGVPQFVFVSSVSAHEAAQGVYGQTKLELERELDPQKDLVIRPGLILHREVGLFARMKRTISGMGVAPLFGGGGQEIQTIHADDLTAGFELAVQRRETGVLTLCEPKGLTMRQLFEHMGERLGRRVRVVSVPFGPALLMLRAAEACGLTLPVSSDNLLGLRSMVHADSGPSLARLGLTVRSAPQSLRDLLSTDGRA